MFYIFITFLSLQLLGCLAESQESVDSGSTLQVPNECGKLNETLTKLDRIEVQQRDLKETLEKIERGQAGPQEQARNSLPRDFNDRLYRILIQQSDLLASLPKRPVPPNFEIIHSRYLYIERNITTSWFGAFNICRRMGGELVTIEGKDEHIHINAQTKFGSFYWIGINNLAGGDEYVSTATGREAKYLNWGFDQPANGNGSCVALATYRMYNHSCDKKFYFICQALDYE